MKKCRPVTEGYVTKEVCDEWPVQRCDVEVRNVSKVTPDTKCWKEPREVCGPVGCGVKDVSSGIITVSVTDIQCPATQSGLQERDQDPGGGSPGGEL